MFRIDPYDLYKELGLPNLRHFYSVLETGLLEHEIKLAESRGNTAEWKAKHLFRMWREKQGSRRYRNTEFLDMLDKLGHKTARERLHTKWCGKQT